MQAAMSQLVISDIAARHLEAWLDQTMRGELVLWQLPPAVAAFYHAGWAERNAAALAEAREYEHQLDLLYLAAYSPKERREEYQRRLDHHFLLEDAAFFAADVEHQDELGNNTRGHQVAA